MKPSYLLYFVWFQIIIFGSCSSDGLNSNNIQNIDSDLFRLMAEQAPNGNYTSYILPESEDYKNIPQDPNNPLTKEKIALGGFLFHETALSVDAKDPKNNKTFSCASCHHASAGFQAGIFQGIGEGGIGFGTRGELRLPQQGGLDIDVQPLKSPSAMNGAFQKVQLWNGQFGATDLNEGTESYWPKGTPIETNHLGFEGLETQAIAGMSVHRLNINEDILKMGTYKNLFDQAFPNVPTDQRYTKKQAGLAIAAYERTLLSNQAPFQKYLRGNIKALTELEKKGASIFFGKAECASCHHGPALNSMQFNALGLNDLIHCPEPTLKTIENDPANLGRGGFTKNAADNYKFKVPQLYNLKDSPFYGHGSSKRSIMDVLVYKNRGKPENEIVPAHQLDPRFKPLQLTSNELNALEAFITNALYDPYLSRYIPNRLPSDLCFPNADLQSRKDMNCF